MSNIDGAFIYRWLSSISGRFISIFTQIHFAWLYEQFPLKLCVIPFMHWHSNNSWVQCAYRTFALRMHCHLDLSIYITCSQSTFFFKRKKVAYWHLSGCILLSAFVWWFIICFKLHSIVFINFHFMESTRIPWNTCMGNGHKNETFWVRCHRCEISMEGKNSTKHFVENLCKNDARRSSFEMHIRKSRKLFVRSLRLCLLLSRWLSVQRTKSNDNKT